MTYVVRIERTKIITDRKIYSKIGNYCILYAHSIGIHDANQLQNANIFGAANLRNKRN